MHPVPPPFFHALCQRWVDGNPTPYDTAVLDSLTNHSPLPHPHSPSPVAFDPVSRLPHPDHLQAYVDVKNAVRQAHHAHTTELQTARVKTALESPLPSISPPFPTALSAAPCIAALLQAAQAALFAPRVVTWSVQFQHLCQAGEQFCIATRIAGWHPVLDIEQRDVVFQCSASDYSIARLIAVLRPMLSPDVIPTGRVATTDRRRQGARAGLLGRFVLRVALTLRLLRPIRKEVAISALALTAVAAAAGRYVMKQ